MVDSLVYTVRWKAMSLKCLIAYISPDLVVLRCLGVDVACGITQFAPTLSYRDRT